MDNPGNFYPNAENYPEPSFPEQVTAPDVEPDGEDSIKVAYSLAWQAVLMAAVDQLLQFSTWEGDKDAKRLAVARANLLKYQLQTPVIEMEPPFWDDPDGGDADDDDFLPDAPWYEQLADWLVTAFIAVTFTPGAAIVYKTTIPRLRLAFRTGEIGAIVRVLIDNIEIWTGVTLTPLRDLLEVDLDIAAFAALNDLTPPYEMRIEHAGDPDGVTGSKLEVIRKRLRVEEYAMGCDCPATLAEVQDVISRNAAQVQRNIAVWTGNAGSIHSYAGEIANFDTGGFGSNKSRQNCSAACAWVRGTVWNEYLLILSLFYTAAAAGSLAWLAGPLGLVLGAASVLIAGMSLAKIQAAMDDEAALDSIGCQLATLLAGDAATSANFSTAIGSLTSATENENTIVQICKASGGSPGFYYYLSLWGEANKLMSGGMILPCCCDDECEFLVNFTTGFPAAWELVTGVYVAGVGLNGQPVEGWPYRVRLYVRLSEPCLPSQINVAGYHAGTIAHDLAYGFGDIQPDGSIVWRFTTQWQGSSGEGSYNHAIVPVGGTQPFDAVYLEINDDQLVRFLSVEFVG